MAISINQRPPDVSLAKNPSYWRILSDAEEQDNVFIEAAVQITRPFQPLLVGTDVVNITPPTIANFELSEYFNAQINPTFTFPDIGIANKLASNNFKNFILAFTENFGTPPAVNQTITIEDLMLVYGKIPDYLHNWFYQNYDSFKSYLTSTKNFLTFWPTTHYISSKAQTEKLFLCNIWESVDQKLGIVIALYFENHATVEIPCGTQVGPPTELYNVWEFHVGYNALDIDTLLLNYEGRKLLKYEIKVGLADNYTNVSSKHTYIIDENHYPYRREFIFRNPLGGYDTFVTTGQASNEAEYEIETNINVPWYGATGPAKKIHQSNYTETIQCHSGPVSAETMAALPMFFLSDDVYEIISGKRYPIEFDSQSIIRKEDRQGLRFVLFAYKYMPIHFIEKKSSG